LKIALYVPSWPPGSRPNGIVTYAGHLVPALRRLGHEVFVLTPELVGIHGDRYCIDLGGGGKLPLWNRVLFKLAPNLAAFQAAAAPIVAALRRLIAEHSIDVFEIEESFGWSSAVSRLRILPVVVRLHGPRFLTGVGSFDPSDIARERWRENAERDGITNADFVTAPSRAVLDDVCAHYRIKLPRSRAFPNPIDHVAMPRRWSLLRCHRDRLLFVGRFDGTKGGDLVIRAFSELAKVHPKLTLTFVGPDSGVLDGSGALIRFEEFCRRVLAPEIRSRINFLGVLSQAEVAELRTTHYITLCMSRSEVFGYSVLEALAFGCPLIAAAVGGIPEIVDAGRTGVLVPAEDVPAMVGAVQALLDDQAQAARYGEEAGRDCEARFGTDAIAPISVAAYQNAIAAFRAEPAT